MMERRYSILCAGLVLQLAAEAAGGVVSLDQDVPSYEWYHGCGPTAAGMVIGYWDANGFPGLIPGTNSWDTNQENVKAMIASEGHIDDYVPKPDADPPHHSDDCVADFMWTSRGTREYGYTSENLVYLGMTGYAEHCGYTDVSGSWCYFGSLWDVFVTEIDAARPMVFYVNSTENGSPDHFITAVGYDDTPDNHRYAFYNTYDHTVYWAPFASDTGGQQWGIRSGSWFYPIPEPATVVLLGLGLAVVSSRRRKRTAG